MADTPVVRAETWLRQHERLIIVALVLAVGAFGLNKYFDVSAARRDARAVAAEQVAADAKANAAQAAITASQTQAQYTALVQALAAQNASLASSIAQRTASQTARATTNATLPVAGVAERWNVIAGTLVTPSGDTIVVSSTDAHKTLDMLESVPVLQANLTDETKIAGNYLAEVQKSDTLVNSLNYEVTSWKTLVDTNATACKAEVAAAKADGNKGKAKWFKIGFVTGFLSGLWAGHAAGL
jgi:multidrug efflux pump subunit AcrA (membrane-fusion protein)